MESNNIFETKNIEYVPIAPTELELDDAKGLLKRMLTILEGDGIAERYPILHGDVVRFLYPDDNYEDYLGY